MRNTTCIFSYISGYWSKHQDKNYMACDGYLIRKEMFTVRKKSGFKGDLLKKRVTHVTKNLRRSEPKRKMNE